MAKVIIMLMVLGSQAMAAEQVFVKELPKDQITKVEALRILITSDNKQAVYKCQQVEVSDKGTIKNK